MREMATGIWTKRGLGRRDMDKVGAGDEENGNRFMVEEGWRMREMATGIWTKRSWI